MHISRYSKWRNFLKPNIGEERWRVGGPLISLDSFHLLPDLLKRFWILNTIKLCSWITKTLSNREVWRELHYYRTVSFIYLIHKCILHFYKCANSQRLAHARSFHHPCEWQYHTGRASCKLLHIWSHICSLPIKYPKASHSHGNHNVMETITHRKYKQIDIEKFKNDIE